MQAAQSVQEAQVMIDAQQAECAAAAERVELGEQQMASLLEAVTQAEQELEEGNAKDKEITVMLCLLCESLIEPFTGAEATRG